MTSIPFEGAVRPAPRGRVAARASSLTRIRPELAGLLVLAAVLNLWALSQNGYANEYYSAAVRAMSTSWHAFLYGSFDSAGVMTVDKPPLALWVQALSVRAFGFHSLSLLVPQALMGVASVGLVYDLVRRRFGRVGGSAAGLVLALTPISVAIARHNNPDALLVLCLVAALWCTVRALEDGRTRWLVLAGVCVGLGFEAKMAAALLVVPALAAAYLWVAPRGRAAAVAPLLGGGAALVVVAGAWPALIALTPEASRPWVSGTSDNSILSLILGYNGLGRLGGQAGGPQGMGGGGVFGGDAGVLRLLNASLGGQAGWLLGFALVAGVALVAATRLRRGDARTGWLIAVGGAFLTTAVAFSAAEGIFHPYYVSALAPFTAALVGAGVGAARRARPHGARARPGGGRGGHGDGAGGGACAAGSARAHRPRHGGALRARGGDARDRGHGRAAQGRARRRAGRAPARAGELVGPDAGPRDERDLPRGRAGGGGVGWGRAGWAAGSAAVPAAAVPAA